MHIYYLIRIVVSKIIYFIHTRSCVFHFQLLDGHKNNVLMGNKYI